MSFKHSIIQSTVVKITVVIFCILIILYFYIARIYWDKEVLERKIELLAVASAVEKQIQVHYQGIAEVKGKKDLNESEKNDQITALLQPSFIYVSKDPKIIIGYYDKDLKSIVYHVPDESAGLFHKIDQEEIYKKIIQSGIPEFISDSEVVDWDGKGIIAAAVPVLYHGEMKGHTLAMIKSSNIFYNSYLDYSKVFVPSIILWIFVLALIKKNIVQIKSSIDSFTKMIISDKLTSNDNLDLPELKPVYDKIRTHLDDLQLLNTRLEESNEKLLTIMEGVSDGFFSLDREWKFTFVNEETKRLVKKENVDLIGKSVWEEVPDFRGNIQNNLQSVIMQNIPLHWEEQFSLEKKCFAFHAYPFAQGLTVFFRDITEIKQRENELVRLERLNLIGQMAAGISHEVRNPLTTVRGFLQMLENRTDSEQNKEYMEIMISEIDRANGIITDFLSLAKANSDSTKPENINEIISRIAPMLQADAYNSNKDIIIDMELVPKIRLNEAEIRQLILNLVRNGLEETSPEGKVYLRTYLEDNCVVLEIKDEGKGIPPEVQEKMGTPFVTTKETGTGLGLAISIGIARRHKARFDYKTGNSGTTFYIIFPVELQELNS